MVGSPLGEVAGEVVVGEHARAAVGAEQDPVAGGDLEGEDVGLGLVDPVDRAQDQVAVRVHPRLVLGDPALVDQALHEGVVGGQLGEGAVAQQVAAAVTDVADADLGAVEDDGRDGGAGALDLGVLRDQAGDAVVAAVDRAGEAAEHVALEVLAGRLVELAEHLDGGRAGDVAARGATDTVGDHEQVGSGVPGVLVVAPNPADVGKRCVAQLHLRSSRIVFPMRIWVPSWMAVAWEMRLVPT